MQKTQLLLASYGMTLDSQAPWIRSLRTVCGPRGIELADILESDVNNPIVGFPVSIRVSVDMPLVHAVLSRSLALLARLNIVTAELALNIHDNRTEMLLLKSPGDSVVLNNLVETTFKFCSATVLQSFEIGCVRGSEAELPGEQELFFSSFSMFDMPHLEQNDVDPVASVLSVLTSTQYGFLFRSWPRSVRALYVRVLQLVTESRPNSLGDFVQAHSASALAALDLMNNAIDRSAIHGGEKNIIRQLDRINILVSFAIGSLAGLVQVNDRLMKDVDYPVQAALPALPDIVATDFLQTSSWTVVQLILENPPMVGADVGRWILIPTTAVIGELPVSTDRPSSKLDGITYIAQQLRSAKCIYHMPLVSSEQIEWQEWFATIKGLIVSFPSMPIELLITCLTSQIKTNDQRIFGWPEKCLYLMRSQGTYTILDWLEHVQDQVISSVTTRKSAYLELCELHHKLKHILDCVGLATKIKQLFKLIFPVLKSKEREPCTWLQAILVVHNLLQTLANYGNHTCHKAWKMHDEYSHSADFREFIKASLHTDNSISSQISHVYLERKCLQLIEAHEQYTQTTEVHAMEPSRASVLALNTGGYAGNKRYRDKSSEGGRKSLKAGHGSDKKVKLVSHAKPSTPSSAFLDTVKKACVNRPDLYPPAIRNLVSSLPKLDKAQCEAAILAGKCLVCQESHSYRNCPVLRGTGPATVLAKQFLKEYHNIRKIENPK